jgi:hypothetical protein
MLAGAAAPSRVCFTLPVGPTSQEQSLLPSDLDGGTAPPPGSPNFVMDIDGLGALHLWKFHVDLATPANSTLTGPITLPAAPFNFACETTQDCIPQPGTTERLDALGERLMYRLVYRRFADHESLVATHTVMTAAGNTAIRWYEIRSPNGTPVIHQQGTFAPDTHNRWMGSIAQDRNGNIAVGYSVGSTTLFPSIRYTGWEVGDPLGTLQAEVSLIEGGGSQTGSNRWGDYSSMRIDPSDDCTFWFTAEYQNTTQPTAWNTRIGSFKFPSCGTVTTPAATSTALVSSKNPSSTGESVTFTATVTSSGGTPAGSVAFMDGATTLGTVSLDASGVATFSTSSLAIGSHSITAVYAGSASFAGSTSPAVTQVVNKLAAAVSLISTQNPSRMRQPVTFRATVTPSAATGTVTFLDGAATLATVTLSSGTAQFSTSKLSQGSHSITARYNGNATYGVSTSTVLTQVVTKK